MHCPFSSVSVTEGGDPDDLQLPHPTNCMPLTESIKNSANFCATTILDNSFIIPIFSLKLFASVAKIIKFNVYFLTYKTSVI